MPKLIQTPWGKAQDVIKHREGFYFYETTGHGGYHLSKNYNDIIPQKYRNEDGWYEEDSEALIVQHFHYDILQPFSKSYIREELENFLGEKVED